MALRKEKYTLSNRDIDRLSDSVTEELSSYRITSENLIRTRISVEEALLRLKEHFGKDSEVEVTAGRRFYRQYIELRLKGEAYNPLRFSESEYEEWNQLLSYADYQPDYQYTGGWNTIKWAIPVRKHHPAISFAVAIVLGVLLGVAGKMIAAANAAAGAGIMAALQPVQEIWLRLLNVLSGPVIFLMIINTVLNMETITRQGGNTGRLLGRVLRVGFISALTAIAVCIICYPEMGIGGLMNDASDITFMILQLVPADPLSPFMESNSPQLLVLAFVLGSALIASGRRYEGIAGLVREANSLGLLITGWMSSIVPPFICLLLAYEIMNGSIDIYSGIWRPVLVFLAVSAVIMAAATFRVSRIEKCSVTALIRALSGPMIRTLREGSADAAYDETLRNCHRKLGIEERFAETSLSTGLVMYMPLSVAGILVFTMYAAGFNEVPPAIMWYVIAAVLAVAMSVATPPVPGVSILTYVVVFSQLGIPRTALIAAMLFDILTGVLIIAGNQYLLQLDMILSAEQMAMLDHRVFRRIDESDHK